MGWRGMLRSMAAAERRQKKATQRQINQLDRLSGQVDRAVDDINAECERDLGKVAEVERRMQDHPLSMGELTYDRVADAWKFKTVADRTGKITWSLTPGLTSDPVRFVGEPVVNGPRRYTPLALTFSRWGTFLAFEVSRSGISSKARKLFTKSDNSKNRVFLSCGDALYQAVEGDLDREVIGSGIAIAAFPLPDPSRWGAPIQVEFHLTDEPVVIVVQGDDLLGAVTKAAGEKSLVDQVAEQFRKELAPMRATYADTKHEIQKQAIRAQGGCLLLVAVAGAVGAAGLAVAWGI